MSNPNFRTGSPEDSADFLSNSEYWESVKQGLLEIHPLGKYYDESDLERDLEKERYFAKVVYEAAKTAVESGGRQVHILFDIDNTIGAYDMETVRKFYFRPALHRILEEVKQLVEKSKAKFDIGFISNRDLKNTNQQLESGGQLASLAQWVNRELVFSSRGAALAEDYKFLSTDEKRLSFLRNLGVIGINDDELSEVFYGMNPDGVDKLGVLSKLKGKIGKDEKVIVIDDSPVYPEILDRAKGFSGVCIRDKGYFSGV